MVRVRVRGWVRVRVRVSAVKGQVHADRDSRTALLLGETRNTDDPDRL